MSDIQEHVAYLTQEVDPHPAGTEEEQQAAFYIADRLEREANLPTVMEEFSCSLNYDLPRIIYCAVAVVMGLLTLFVPALVIPSFILTAIAAVLYIVDVLRIFSFGQFSHAGISQNVVAKYQPASSRQARNGRNRKIVFVARYDSGKIQQELRKPFFSILPALHWAEFVAIILIPVLLLIRFIAGAGGGLLIFINIIVVICAILVLLPIITYLIHFAADYEEGANCNAAGVAVMLEAAARVGRGYLSGNTSMAPDSDQAVIHGETAARESGLVPEGADLVYEAPITQAEDGELTDESAESRLMAAKAAVAALSGEEVSGVADVDVPDYVDQRQVADVSNYETRDQTNIPGRTFDEKSYVDNESFVPIETAKSVAYPSEDNIDTLPAETQRYSEPYSEPDNMQKDLQKPIFAEEAYTENAYTEEAPLATGESYNLSDSDISAGDLSTGGLETEFGVSPTDKSNDVFNDFTTGVDNATDVDNAENKVDSIPSWFKSAQEKAHKPANEVVTAQRSRYADALDSAMNESNTYFRQANDAITSETEQRLQNMRDSIMEVTPPSFDDINNALADADKQFEDSKTEEKISAINKTDDSSVADIEITDKITGVTTGGDSFDNVSSKADLFSGDSLVDAVDSANPVLKMSEESKATEVAMPSSEATFTYDDRKKAGSVLAHEDAKATFVPEERTERERDSKRGEYPEREVDLISEESTAALTAEEPAVREAALTSEEPAEHEEALSIEEPEEYEAFEQSDISEVSSPSSVVSNGEELIEQQDRVKAENELYESVETPREEADLGRTISFIPVAIDEEQLRQEVSERNVDNMDDIVDVPQDLPQKAESFDDLSSQNEPFVASTEDKDDVVSQEQPAISDRFVVPKVFSQSSTGDSDANQKTTRRRRDIDLPGLTQSLTPVDVPEEELKQSAPLGDDALLSHNRSQKLKELSFSNDAAESATSAKDDLAARQAALRTSLPSVSGSITFEDAQAYVSDFAEKSATDTARGAEPSANVSQAGSFASSGATGAFDPVGDELVEDIAPDEIYVDDADDSDYNDQFTEMGAFAGPGYVEMPKSRASRLFGRFRRSGKKIQEEEETPQQWLNVEDDFEAREVGKARGGWESFKENEQKDIAFDASEDFSEEDNLAKADAATKETDFVEKDSFGGMSAFDDDDSYDSQSSLWDGGAFGRERLNESIQNELQSSEQDIVNNENQPVEQDFVQNEPQPGEQDTAQLEPQINVQEKAAERVARRDAARGTRGDQRGDRDEKKERGSRKSRRGRGDGSTRNGRRAQNVVQETERRQEEAQEGAQEETQGRSRSREQIRGRNRERNQERIHERIQERNQEGNRERNQERTSPAAGTSSASRAADMQHIRQFRYGSANTEVWFVALGCELADNGGIKAFMNEHADELKGSIIVELEGLGAGKLTLVEHEGTYRSAKSSSRAKRYIRKAASALGLTVDSKPMRWKESSAACAARSGYQTLHLAGMEDDKPAYYGEADDVIEQVSEQTMRQNADFILEFLKNI